MPPSAAPSLFYPFRALGYVSEGAPFAVQRRGTETFVTVSAGKAWQIYNCDKLRLVMVGPQFGDAPDIRALAAKGDLTFAAVGRDVAVCRRSHRLCTFEGHAESITHLFVFGGDLISVCAGASSRTSPRTPWTTSTASAAPRAETQRVQAEETTRTTPTTTNPTRTTRNLPPTSALRDPRVRAPARLPPHGGVPPGHVPEQDFARRRHGRLCLLNVKTGSVIHVFEPDAMGNRSGASVTCLENSPRSTPSPWVYRTVASSCTTRHASRLSTLATRVRKTGASCAFSTGQGEPVLAVAGDSGRCPCGRWSSVGFVRSSRARTSARRRRRISSPGRRF